MAAPTISSIGPSVGAPSGGQLVEVLGANFQMVPPPSSLGPVPPHPPTVRVLFDGVASPRVAVITSGRLLVVTPRKVMPSSGADTHGEAVVDVVVENIDEGGEVIPGEQATAVEAYTYRRPDASTGSEAALTSLVRALLRLLKGEVLANTVLSVHTDYDRAPATAAVETAEVPALVLSGPSMTVNTLHTSGARLPLRLPAAGELLMSRRPLHMDLSFDLILITQSDMQLLNLIELITVVIDRISRFTLVVGAPLGSIDLDVNWTDPMEVSKQSNQLSSNLRVATGRFTVAGFPFSTITGVEQDAAQDVAAVLQASPSLQPPEQVGDNLPAKQGGSVRSPH